MPERLQGAAELKRALDELKKAEKRGIFAVEELAELIIETWGGKKAYVKALKKAYDKAGDGSLAQQRIMEGNNRIILSAAKMNVESASDDELLSREQIEARIVGLRGYVKEEDQEPDDGAKEISEGE